MRAAISRTDCSNCMCMKGAPTQEVVGSAAVEPNQCSREGAADVCSEESSLASHVRVGRVGCDSRSTFTWCALTVLLRDGYSMCSGQCVLCVCGAGRRPPSKFATDKSKNRERKSKNWERKSKNQERKSKYHNIKSKYQKINEKIKKSPKCPLYEARQCSVRYKI